MRVICRHGHIAFYPRKASDVTRFCGYFGVELERVGEYYTFPALAALDRYSIVGNTFGNLPAVKTFEGESPWEIMKENGFVYHIDGEILIPKSLIAIKINPPLVGEFFIAESPLIQPGSRNAAGLQILSYDGEYLDGLFQLRVSEFSYE